MRKYAFKELCLLLALMASSPALSSEHFNKVAVIRLYKEYVQKSCASELGMLRAMKATVSDDARTAPEVIASMCKDDLDDPTLKGVESGTTLVKHEKLLLRYGGKIGYAEASDKSMKRTKLKFKIDGLMKFQYGRIYTVEQLALIIGVLATDSLHKALIDDLFQNN